MTTHDIRETKKSVDRWSHLIRLKLLVVDMGSVWTVRVLQEKSLLSVVEDSVVSWHHLFIVIYVRITPIGKFTFCKFTLIGKVDFFYNLLLERSDIIVKKFNEIQNWTPALSTVRSKYFSFIRKFEIMSPCCQRGPQCLQSSFVRHDDRSSKY